MDITIQADIPDLNENQSNDIKNDIDPNLPNAKRHCSSTNIKDMTDSEHWKRTPGSFHLLVGCTGSVASIVVPDLISEIRKLCTKYEKKLKIKIVATENALKFFDPGSLDVPTYDDKDEWSTWRKRGDPVLHIELRKWADLLIIAPLDANTLSKIANGMCDNLLTCIVRAWDFRKPLYFCPAMNTFMWDHPLTIKHIDVLKGLLGFKEIPCIEKTLMCGDKGLGAMASLPMIASVAASEVKKFFAVYTG